jgi:hypothetical protein
MRTLACLALSAFLASCGGGGGGDDADGDATEDAIDDATDASTEEPSGSHTFDDEVRVERGEAYAIHIGPDGEITPDPVLNPLDELPDTAAEAVLASPGWIQEDLARTLWHLEPAQADTLAGFIMAADPLEVDEVAWSIAVTAPQVLSWMLAGNHARLFGENADAIYAMDGLLTYARLVELDDMTTLEVDGETGTYQLDPEMYYWYVVYPRAYMGLPSYFEGNFWRTMFRITTPTAPDIAEAVAAAATIQEAAEAVGYWIQDIMTFGYGTNELQPVEIYQNRFGSCGQYSIITTAAAKTVFIPTASVSARADDHEWNELWDGRWIMWDNSLGDMPSNPNYPYIDWPEIMDDDLYTSGGVFGEVAHVLRYREDGAIFACDQYTGYEQQVTITVRDASGDPVEGARVIARSAESGYHPCTWSYTDHQGAAVFMLGDDLAFGFTSDHPLFGTQPPGGVDPTLWTYEDEAPTEDSVAFGDSYARSLTDAGAPAGDHPLTLDFTVLSTEQRRVNVITEGFDLGDTYPGTFEGGVIDVYLVDQAGYDAFAAGGAFDAYSVHLASEEGSMELTIPAGEDWYVILDNALWPVSTKFVSVQITSGS